MRCVRDKTTVIAKTDGFYIGESKLTDFVPHIIEVKWVLKADGFQISYRITVCRYEEPVDTISVSDLYVVSWFALSPHCPDASLSKHSRKLIQEFLEREAAKLPIRREILLGKYGWHFTDYGTVFYRREIIMSEMQIPVHSEKSNVTLFQAEDYSLNVPNCNAILQIINKVAVGTSWILYMASYFDILKHLFYEAGYPVQFVLNVYGKSGSGKTSLIKAICSPSQTFSFRSTKRRDTILREIAKFEGHTVLVDDYHPAESSIDRDRQAGLKDSLVRAVEETVDFPNVVISSEFLDGHASLQDREIQLYLDEKLDWKLLEALETHQELLERIRTAFYIQIVSHAEEIVSDIKEYCMSADNNCTVNGDRKFRSERYVNYIFYVNQLFQKYFVDKYSINFPTIKIADDLQFQLNRQVKHMEITKTLEQKGTYLLALRDLLLCKNIFEQIADWNEYLPSPTNIHIDSHGVVSISQNALRRGMMIYLQSNHVPMKRIVKELLDAEALITYEKGNEFTQKHNGKRCYRIDTDALNEYCSFFE